jgi:hypothetical protein
MKQRKKYHLKISKYDFSFRVDWNSRILRTLPRNLGISFSKGFYLKTKSGIEPYYWWVSLNLIWVQFTLFCDVHYKNIFELKIPPEN